MSVAGRRVLLGLLLGASALLASAVALQGTGLVASTSTDGPRPAAQPTIQHAAATSTVVAPERLTGPADEPSAGRAVDEASNPTDGSTGATLDLSGIRSLPPAAELPKAPTLGPVPIAIRIAEIGLADGRVVPVGVDDEGAYEVPQVSDVGWYRFGPAPGAGGSTVLAAHVAFDGTPGVFQNLAAVQPGTVVRIVMSDATTVSYEVGRVVDYRKADLPIDSLFDESGPDRLVLITCGGAFNPAIRSYGSNTVAYATRLD